MHFKYDLFFNVTIMSVSNLKIRNVVKFYCHLNPTLLNFLNDHYKSSVVLVDIDEYLKGILSQILTSHKILTELDDDPNDLETIKKELSKIRGLLQVIHNKLNEKKYQADHLVTLSKLTGYYIDTYDFTREIEVLSQVYFNDSNRLKNLRVLIINSLNDKKMIEKLHAILIKL